MTKRKGFGGGPTHDLINPIIGSGTGLVQSSRAVGTVCLGRHKSGLLPECFGHVQNIRVVVVQQCGREAIGQRSNEGQVAFELIGQRSC